VATLGLNAADKEALEAFRRDVIEPSMTSLVILYFTAAWCGPCKALGPIIDKVAADYAAKGVVLAKLDVDANKAIAAQFRVQSIPTVYAIFQGQPVADLSPARTESQLVKAIDQILGQLPVQGEAQAREAEIEPLIAMGEEVLAGGDGERAAGIFAQLMEMAPDNVAVLSGHARALIAAGRTDEARALIAALPEGQAADPALARAKAALDLSDAAASAGGGEERAALEARIAKDDDDHEARLALAGLLIGAGERDAAADHLLESIARDREWNEGAARKRLLQLLEVTGLEDPWAGAQRRRLSAILFT